MTLISADNIFALSAILVGFAFLGFWADGTAFGKKTSGALWVIVGALTLSNFRVIPFESPVYGFIGGYLVPLSIPLLLYKADLRKIVKESGGVMITFLLACVATVVGAVAGFFLLNMGDLGAKVAGVYTGGWTGGTVNFVAVSKAVELTPDEFSVALSANSVVSIMALMCLIAIPSIALIRRFVPSSIIDKAGPIEEQVQSPPEAPSLHLTHVSGGLALSFAICAAAFWVAKRFDIEQYSILLITVFVIVIANVMPKTMQKIEGDFDIGMMILYIFFASIGAGTNATAFLGAALNLFFFSVIILAVHLTVVLLAARLFKFDLAEAVVGSAAALVGPVPAAAIAMARGWRTLITPGIMCGIFGYVIGTFIGVAVTAMLS